MSGCLCEMSVCASRGLTKMSGQKRCSGEAASGSSSSTKKAKRQVTKATFQKWQREHNREHQTLSWHHCEMERDTVHIASLHCALYKKYEGHLQSLKNFNAAWITRSTNQKVSNILDRAGSGVHKAALARKRAEASRAHGESVVQSSPIGCAVALDLPTRARMGRIFDLCFMMAKESVAFAK